MQSETIVFSDDGRVTHRTRSNRVQFNKLHLGLGCFGIVCLSMLIAVTMYASVTNNRKSFITTETKEDKQEISFKVIFSTNYQQDNKSQTLDIIHFHDLTNQLNEKLNGQRILILDAFFRDRSVVIKCENVLSGNALQLNMVAFFPRQCVLSDENQCKLQFQKQLKRLFDELFTFSLTIQLSNNRDKRIDIKICHLIELMNKSKRNNTKLTKNSKVFRSVPVNIAKPYMLLSKSLCTLNPGKINLVQIAGAYGTRIHDDAYQSQLTVTFYEDMTYRLHIQFDCNEQTYNNCDPSLIVHVWIDYNNNEDNDEGESQVLGPARLNHNTPESTYDLELYIPVIDGIDKKLGAHLMRLTVTPSEEYQKECGFTDAKETREYTVNIVPKAAYPADTTPSAVVHGNDICYKKSGKIALVIMAGERGTEIRDDQPAINFLSDDNRNRYHHLAVTIYEHTVYLLRVQLDCFWQFDHEFFEHGCNLAQEVNVWIDINDDGRYDQSELGTPYRWPVTSYMPQGNYDLQLNIPLIDGQYFKAGKHQMRLIVQSSDYYRRTCNRIDYNETRDYTVNIIPRSGYIPTDDNSIPYFDLNNIICSIHRSKIQLVIMAGEHRTQIRDDITDNNQNQQHQAIVLYENTVYLSRIQFYCHEQSNCHLIYDVQVWIDLNDDGRFDSSENAVPFRWPLHSYTPQGIYDLQISVPSIDAQRVRAGPRRMQLIVTMNEFYRKKCGENDYKETREYTVSIVPNTGTSYLVDSKIPILKLSDNVCSLPNAKLALVIMAGEQGTEIRDNILTNTVLRENQNRHHLSVSLYESTIYRLRVTLDCHPRPSGGLPDLHCNLAQDVNVLIDLNNDQRFDENESRVAQRWPLRSTMPLGIYDFEIEIPAIDRLNNPSGSHRLRIVVMPSEEYHRKCGRTDFQDAREYTINIIPRIAHRGVEMGYYPPVESRVYPTSVTTYCPVGNLACSEGSNGISLVSLFGEQNTEIRDEFKACNPANNYHDRSHLIVTLFENSVYTLRIETYCVQNSCNQPKYIRAWIDLNNDGVFDETQGEMISNNWYENDLRIHIPSFNNNEQHRMRLILTQDESQHQACYNTGYGEARDYTLHILPKPIY